MPFFCTCLKIPTNKKEEGQRDSPRSLENSTIFLSFRSGLLSCNPNFARIITVIIERPTFWGTAGNEGTPPPMGDSYLVPCLSPKFFFDLFQVTSEFFLFFRGKAFCGIFFGGNLRWVLKKNSCSSLSPCLRPYFLWWYGCIRARHTTASLRAVPLARA